MSRIQESSISRKLTWMNMLVSGIALLLACSAFATYDLITFRKTMVRNLSIQAQIIGANSVSAVLFDDQGSAENTLSALQAAPNVTAAGIYTPDGLQFAAYTRDQGGKAAVLPTIPHGQIEASWITGGQIVLVRSIIFKGAPTETVFIRADLREMYDRLERFVGIVIIVLAGSLTAAFAISRMSQRAISQPIADLAHIARVVSRDKNYSVRAAPAGARGELALLTEAFNEMLAQIQQRDAALRASYDELDLRVHERTNELAAANNELEAFSYSVSHDLRAPLRSIDGFSQALLEDYADKLDAGGKNYLQRVRSATQRMSVLIDDLLNLSRVTRSEMRREGVNLSALAESVMDDLRKADPHRGVQVLIADDLVAQGDSRLLRVVMENLLGNAWKYTSRHDGATIEFGLHQNGGRPVYFVRDDGAGFDATYADRLFGAFQRLHAPTEFPGTGIGLATVQRIINETRRKGLG